MTERAQQRPPGEESGVGAAARRTRGPLPPGRCPRPGTAPPVRRRRRRTRALPRGGAPADGDRVRHGPVAGELGGELLAGDLELAPVVGRAADVVELGPEHRRQQLVAHRPQWLVAGHHEVDLEAEDGAGGSRDPAVVGLLGPDGDQRPGAELERLAAEELQFARLVAPGAEPGQVVALDPEPDAAGQPGAAFEGRRQGRQRGRAGRAARRSRPSRAAPASPGDGRRAAASPDRASHNEPT